MIARVLGTAFILLLLSSCGWVWVTASNSSSGRLAQSFFGPVTLTSAGTVYDATGRPDQSHLVYTTGTGTWWLFYITSSSPNVIQTLYSADLNTWNAGNSVTLGHNLSNGTNFGITTKNISGTDVVHVPLSYEVANTDRRHYHIRATATGNITWGAESAQIDTSGTDPGAPLIVADGPFGLIGSDNKIYDVVGFWNDGGGFWDDMDVSQATNPDLGSSWAAGFQAGVGLLGLTGAATSHFGAPLAAGQVLIVEGGGGTGAQDVLNNFYWSTWSGAAWSGAAHVLGANFGASIAANDWTGVYLNSADIRLFYRITANTFGWQKFDGAAWSTPPQSIPNQTSGSATGPFAATDGTNIWLFIIDSDGANTVRYVKFDGSNWGTWKALETSSQVRTYLSGYPQVINNSIQIIWTEVNGANYNIVLRSLATP